MPPETGEGAGVERYRSGGYGLPATARLEGRQGRLKDEKKP
ncbi:hypothetical protein [Streptomyces sp. NPDC006309]